MMTPKPSQWVCNNCACTPEGGTCESCYGHGCHCPCQKPTSTESAVKHTPGPWKFYRDHPGTADIAYLRPEGARGWDTATEIAVIYLPNEHEANALLIASAPELLEALINLSAAADNYKQSHAGDCDCEFCLAIKQADAVAKQAKGE